MEPLSEDEIDQLLDHATVAHVGLARDGHAYVLPVFFAYDGAQIWFHSHAGLKEDYLEATDEACLTVTTVEAEDVWASVQVFGPVEQVEITADERRAMDALMTVPEPPTTGDGEGLFYWRLDPSRRSGRKSVRPREPDVFDIQ